MPIRSACSRSGGSAGGLLMGAIANMAPGDYRGIVAQVPFVDIVTTMLDDSIPLTTNEFDEWGNPAEKTYYDYMLSYSPYDNVAPAGRIRRCSSRPVCGTARCSTSSPPSGSRGCARARPMRTCCCSARRWKPGHGGKSGRFQRYREIAEEYAFVLDQAGIAK